MDKGMIKEQLDQAVNDILGKIMTEQGIKAGDIYPEQSFKLSRYLDEVEEIMIQVLEQNK